MYIPIMLTHSDIIQQLGGIRKVARRLRHRQHTKVQGWADRDRIPVDHWEDVLALAKEDGLPVDANDLMSASPRASQAAA